MPICPLMTEHCARCIFLQKTVTELCAQRPVHRRWLTSRAIARDTLNDRFPSPCADSIYPAGDTHSFLHFRWFRTTKPCSNPSTKQLIKIQKKTLRKHSKIDPHTIQLPIHSFFNRKFCALSIQILMLQFLLDPFNFPIELSLDAVSEQRGSRRDYACPRL